MRWAHALEEQVTFTNGRPTIGLNDRNSIDFWFTYNLRCNWQVVIVIDVYLSQKKSYSNNLIQSFVRADKIVNF